MKPKTKANGKPNVNNKPSVDIKISRPRRRRNQNMRSNGPRFSANEGSGVSNQRSVAAAYSTGISSMPAVINASRDSSRIIHRELLASVTGTTAFTTQTFPLNPGLFGTFPWLSTQAQGWETYHFNKLRFCYYTRTGSNTPGSVMLIPDYDAGDAAPVSEQIASDFIDTVEDVPWKDLVCTLRERAMHETGTRKFVRLSAVPAGQDQRLYDVGSFFLGSTDGTAVSWGKLWVEYDITFYSPQLVPGGSSAPVFQSVITTAPTTALFVGTASGTPVRAGSQTGIVTIASDVVTFNVAGTFFVNYVVNGTTCTQTVAPAVGGGAAFASYLNGNASSVAGSGTAAMIQSMIVIAVVGGTLTFNNTLVAGTAAELSVISSAQNLI